MPEISIICRNGKVYETNIITVQAFRTYADLMEKKEKSGAADMLENMYYHKRILQGVFDPPPTMAELDTVGMKQFLTATNIIHYVMQNVVIEKFNELSAEPPEPVKKSAFEEYDKEEGWEDEEDTENRWRALKDSVDRIIKIATRALNTGYGECMKTDIIALLEHVKFEIDTIDENENEQ